MAEEEAKAKAEKEAKAVEEAELERLEAEAAIALEVAAKEKVEEAAKVAAALEAAKGVAAAADADEPPDDYLCPITHELMNDPVMAADGHTYERTAIGRWLKTNTTSPKSGDELESKALLPNYMARSLIREWQDAHRS